ncbi:hypothetical protein AC578_8733 [Pseudocercospora eumusae]|uniref:Uncharacterized protein n=1 Tax=Pseudocercospora eumusae TaxID=321146 RepID=A0A139HQ87_9PEZI|nr:hypothetical protein AC578_8733 [Pseudocercospora eumusae]
MPRPKRPLAELDPNEQRVSSSTAPEDAKPKRQRTNAKTQFEQSAFTGKYEYACIGRPPWAGHHDEDADDEESKVVWKKSASEHPRWKWIMLRESFDLLDAAYKDTDNRDPDTFGMYIYNDFLGYGIIEILENMLRAFNKELKPQKGKGYNYQQMWAVVTALANYVNRDASMPYMMVDDAERCERLNAVIGCLILTALNELDRIGQLHKDSKFRDLGHVMALYLLFSKTHDTTEIEYPALDSDGDGEGAETVDWQDALVAYAEKADIDLLDQGVYGIAEVLPEAVGYTSIGKAKVERWKWTEVLREYREEYLTRSTILALATDNIGGHYYDITKWSPEERAKCAFDHKDPLAGVLDEDSASDESEDS